MSPHLTIILLATLSRTPASPSSDGFTEIARVPCAVEGTKPQRVALVEQRETSSGAPRGAQERRTLIELPGGSALRFDDSHVTAGCEKDAVRLTWTSPRGEAASVRLVPTKAGSLALEPGLGARLERAWSSAEGQELHPLQILLESLPAQLRPEAPLLDLAALAAARQALQRENFMLAELLLTEPAPHHAERHTTLLSELKRARIESQPLSAGEPVRLGTKARAVTVPPFPDADVFWRGESVCVAQEDRTPPTAMRCYDTRRRKWGPREPRRISDPVPGKVTKPASEAACDFRELCWHSALKGGDGPCEGIPCDELLAELPGPRLVTFGLQGLLAVAAPGDAGTPMPEGVPPEALAKLPGSVLAGGHLYFAGSVLVDAAKAGRAWEPFAQVVERAWDVLLSPDRRHALVTSSPETPGAPIPLWLVPLTWKPAAN